jgi:hypothetical protein
MAEVPCPVITVTEYETGVRDIFLRHRAWCASPEQVTAVREMLGEPGIDRTVWAGPAGEHGHG